MNKLAKIIILFLLITNCSLDNKSGIWTKEKKTKLSNNKNIFILEKEEFAIKEFNKNLKISIDKITKDTSISINDNNVGIGNFSGKLKNTKKYNFSKIKRFNEFDPELTFYRGNIFFFDNNGSVLKLDQNFEPIWKKNHYLKYEKKLKPILYIAAHNNTLIIADTISKLYAVNIESGDILWTTHGKSPFNSQVKIYKDKVFIVDTENNLNCYDIKDGKKIWSLSTEGSFISSGGKLSVVIKNDKIFFNNSLGDITALDINSGGLIWQISTQNSLLFEDILNLKNSTLVASDNAILFSNNKNEFYSLDQESGKINWKQKVNSNLTPILTGNLLVTISSDGFLFYIERKTGNVIKIISIFNQLSEKLKKKTKPVGFTMTNKDLFITTNNGRLINVNIENGKIKSILKIDNDKISKPFISNQNMFIMKNRSVIKYNG